MKKILIIIYLLASSACGYVTDVGNPTLTQTITGNYQTPSTRGGADAQGDSDGDAPAGLEVESDPVTTCSSESDAEKSIQAGDESGKVILVNFFSYSDTTKQITADLDELLEILTFETTSETESLNCTGTISSSGSVSIAFECSLTQDQTLQECSLTLEQGS